MHFAWEGTSALSRASQQGQVDVVRLFFWLCCGCTLVVYEEPKAVAFSNLSV